jgi:hypothetical protein
LKTFEKVAISAANYANLYGAWIAANKADGNDDDDNNNDN